MGAHTTVITTTVQPGDRIDTLAFRILGDSNKWRELLAVNPHLDIFNPKPGQQVVVPDAQ